MSLFALTGLAVALFMSGAMGMAWALRMKTGQSGWIDAIWSAATGLASLAAILLAGGSFGRQVLAGCLILAWSGRLALHIVARTRGGGDDPRYAALAREWGADFPRQLCIFLQIQAIAALPLVLAVALAAAAPQGFPAWTDFAAALVAGGALFGEAIADAQLARYRRSAKPGGICDIGLWRHSRHPNYFFEWLFWCAWPLMAFDPSGHYPQGLLALAAPCLIYWLLVHVSGVPPLERHMRASRGAAFEAYRRRVNVFFPGPARRYRG
jgi:steroid 5-alpha reductase family enzyme